MCVCGGGGRVGETIYTERVAVQERLIKCTYFTHCEAVIELSSSLWVIVVTTEKEYATA